ncbi:MAG TPA: N-acetyl-1-D-myo-inositol-2-amino-2-deoxy-alpha-D-glucopyranoside deacetylase [Frankiaceae bacterium]|nr:N-acetyl-1-D-myo-inositol-2-amino-2-deoxy-alpha-D-glucopyranoside deacetylase [Frankiaceae bacterium]
MTSSPSSEPTGMAAPPEGDAMGDLIADVEEAVDPLHEGVDMTPLDHPHRLLLVHAHPDDEVISTGGTMARYAGEHALVTLITCTLGEEGEIVVPHLEHLAASREDGLGWHRIEELAAACEALGVKDHRFLGGPGRWRDSGMMGEPTNDNPASFWKADLTEAARDLVAIMREVRPQVVITYDENGGYGHPDHIQAHNVTVAAFDLSGDASYEPELGEPWAPAKLYYQAIPRSQFLEGMQALKDRGVATPEFDEEPSFIVEDHLITTVIDASGYLQAKVAAMRAHESQIAVDDFFFAMADGGGRMMFAQETFRLVRGEVGPTGPDGKETDVFAGIGE